MTPNTTTPPPVAPAAVGLHPIDKQPARPLAFPALTAALEARTDHNGPKFLLAVTLGYNGTFHASMMGLLDDGILTADAPTFLGALSLLDGELFAEQNRQPPAAPPPTGPAADPFFSSSVACRP